MSLTYCVVRVPAPISKTIVEGKLSTARDVGRWWATILPAGEVEVEQMRVDWPQSKDDLVRRVREEEPLHTLTSVGTVASFAAGRTCYTLEHKEAALASLIKARYLPPSTDLAEFLT